MEVTLETEEDRPNAKFFLNANVGQMFKAGVHSKLMFVHIVYFHT